MAADLQPACVGPRLRPTGRMRVVYVVVLLLFGGLCRCHVVVVVDDDVFFNRSTNAHAASRITISNGVVTNGKVSAATVLHSHVASNAYLLIINGIIIVRVDIIIIVAVVHVKRSGESYCKMFSSLLLFLLLMLLNIFLLPRLHQRVPFLLSVRRVGVGFCVL